MFKIIIQFLCLLMLWYFLIFLVQYLKRKADLSKVVQTSNLWAYSFQVFFDQINVLWKVIKILFNKWLEYSENKELQHRKMVALDNTKNHISKNLEKDTGLKTTKPATTSGVDLWVYLVNSLNDSEESRLEDYFSGVLSKYTAEFALDILVIEQNGGAGWIAKFDVKAVAEATYNRMARASKVETKEEFEDIDLW